ncbi:Mur ligase family protein, partial [Candidatus Neomicrothrix sp.]|uniref:Mur ligase family protein n=1 Tax=Candidatus Neomicrothrix sp. TaxID=2719034 RepID=UPI002B5EF90E
IQELLARAVEVGATHAVVEASSQGLSDQRLVDVPASVGICTTIGSDHLEVHGSDAAYRRAMRQLFCRACPAGVAGCHPAEGGGGAG